MRPWWATRPLVSTPVVRHHFVTHQTPSASLSATAAMAAANATANAAANATTDPSKAEARD